MAYSTIPETHLVSDKITPVVDAEIDKLEKSIGVLPPGYREYLQRFGVKGEYEGVFYVTDPQFVLRDVTGDRASLLSYANLDAEGYADWADEDVTPEGTYNINRSDINQAFVLGGNDEGDQIAFTPSRPGSVFLFHRHSEHVVEIHGGFLDPLRIAFDGEYIDCFRFFEPSHSEICSHTIYLGYGRPNDSISRWIQEYWAVDAKFRMQMPHFWGDDTYKVFVKSIGGMCTVVSDSQKYVQVMYDAKQWWDRVADFERWINDRDKRPLAAIDRAWRSWNDGTVVKLAQALHDECAQSKGQLNAGQLAILADALEEAGCTDQDILRHCREPGPFTRSSWVVDLLLKRE